MRSKNVYSFHCLKLYRYCWDILQGMTSEILRFWESILFRKHLGTPHLFRNQKNTPNIWIISQKTGLNFRFRLIQA